jgi:hypothetical protein
VRRIVAFLIAVVATSVANPTMEWIEISEFQTAPQGFERIELHSMLYPERYPFELGGLRLVTNAGTATIDSGVFFDTLRRFVVLNSENTTGTFSLGDDSDHIRIYVPLYGDTFPLEVRYPANPYFQGSWAPPSGASASMYGLFMGSWYVDLSPTFRAYNDDDGGGFGGHVRDQDSGLNGATVRIKSALGYGTAVLGTHHDTIQGDGWYQLMPTGPGRFVLSAECEGYLPYTYPETIELGPNDVCWMDLHLVSAAMAEEVEGHVSLVWLRQRGRMLVLNAAGPGTVLVSVYDNLGRVRMSEKVALVSGSNELALPSLRSGVYFASCRFGERTLKTKLVLY